MTTNNLTEQWKKGELKPNTYFCKIKDNDYIFRLNYEQGMFFDYFWERMEYDDVEQVLAPVPSYEEWQPFTDPYFRGLTTKDISELAKKSIRLTTQNCEDNARFEKLEELLKECREYVVNTPVYPQGDEEKQKEIHRLVDKINEVLK